MTGSEPICSSTKQRVQSIRELNDRFRASFDGGKVLVTCGIQTLGPEATAVILHEVARFDDFTPANDPHGEHDFGALEWRDQTILWKIDYYDENLEFASADPSDPAQTARVLTIMLASEY
jgi:hypothetical protein